MPTVSAARGFWISAAVVLLLAIVSSLSWGSDSALDIPLHDTYFVIAYVHWYLAIALLLGGYALLYVLLERFFRLKLARSLTLAHFFLTLPFMLYLCAAVSLPMLIEPAPRRYYSYTQFETSTPFFGVGLPLAVVLVLFAAGQLGLLIAIIKAVYSRVR